MTRPKLSSAMTWQKLEQEILDVFRDALARLAGEVELPRPEPPINLKLHVLALQVHMERINAGGSVLFSIMFNTTNQPEIDDSVGAPHLRKMPDFCCVITNAQAGHVSEAQIYYYLECKRLGLAEGSWVLNENYSKHGMNRFVSAEWSYGKGCASGTMIGYVQRMEPADVIAEVNTFARTSGLPSLKLAAAAWAEENVNDMQTTSLTRTVLPSPFSLGHLWVDLRHCQFVEPPPPAVPKVPKATKGKEAVAKGTRKPRKKAA